ncbi:MULTISPECIES: hypothetical protein [Halogeometricum]|uniref:Uncharacterized protein n=2 Tax=Halogeometricum TaxID=60846 RepID=A0ABU2G6V8_9EURY|nr:MULTISPECIES: hypothetical protein [unclassified Halogeometricum]MDS0296521.1 hypothetical protein [Halogeometricum sp. S3BR5-2]MDS0297545.1 hypothetical protein [Halogeometricum sp. S1BR25-6]
MAPNTDDNDRTEAPRILVDTSRRFATTSERVEADAKAVVSHILHETGYLPNNDKILVDGDYDKMSDLRYTVGYGQYAVDAIDNAITQIREEIQSDIKISVKSGLEEYLTHLRYSNQYDRMSGELPSASEYDLERQDMVRMSDEELTEVIRQKLSDETSQKLSDETIDIMRTTPHLVRVLVVSEDEYERAFL